MYKHGVREPKKGEAALRRESPSLHFENIPGWVVLGPSVTGEAVATATVPITTTKFRWVILVFFSNVWS